MKFTLVTPHGDMDIPLTGGEESSVSGLLKKIGLPANSVSMYAKNGGELSLVCGLQKTLSEIAAFSDNGEIYVRTDRNIDYDALISKRIKTQTRPEAVAEYQFTTHEKNNPIWHVEMAQADCREFVLKKVDAFLSSLPELDKNRKIVLGISGGGDSNTLVQAFLATGKVQKEQLIPMMILGIPDWDKGLPRAQSICADFGLTLEIVTPEDMAKLMGRRKTDDSWVRDFERMFPECDLEAIGTLAIRLALHHMARKHDAQAAVIGLNLEDILAEGIMSIMEGKMPSPFPTRKVDGTDFWYPLYQCPKKILDGCHPTFSLQNYQDRFPSKMYWRAIAYYMAQSLNSTIPGIEFEMMRGLQKLSTSYEFSPNFESSLGFSVNGTLNDDARSEWEKFLSA